MTSFLVHRENLEKLKIHHPKSQLDYSRNKFVDKIKSYLLPESENVRQYGAKPKFYGYERELELKKYIQYFLSGEMKNKLSENSFFVLSVLKEAMLDDREKSSQRINSGKKALYNKAVGTRYEAWERLLDYAAPKLLLSSKNQIDMLNFMYKFNINCSDETYEQFCRFVPNGAYDQKSCDKIFEYICFRMSKPAGGKYISVYAPFVQNYTQHTQKLDLRFLSKYINLNLDMAEKADDYWQKFDFSILEEMLKKRAKLNPKGDELDLFTKIRPAFYAIDKKAVFLFSDLLAERLRNKNSDGRKLAYKSTLWLQKLVDKNDFNYTEIKNLQTILDAEKVGTYLTEKRFHDFAECIEMSYLQKRMRDVEKINQWVYKNSTQDKQELLSLRSVYVNLLSERLVRDRSVEPYNADVYFRAHKQLVSKQKCSFAELQRLAEETDGPKIDNLRLVLKKVYSDTGFYEETMSILDSFNSNAKEQKILQMPTRFREEYYH